jgi:threonyl-tRNA synthetase
MPNQARSPRCFPPTITAKLVRAGLRSRLDTEDGTLSRRIAVAHHDGVPFVVVIGDREIRDTTLAVRARDGRWSRPVADAIAELARRCAAHAGEEVPSPITVSVENSMSQVGHTNAT